MADYSFDNAIGAEVVTMRHRGQPWRFPRQLAGRYEPESVLSRGGFGVLLTARDRRVFDRKVLIKTGYLDENELRVRNNASIPGYVAAMRKRFGIERSCLLHGQMRGIDGIPVLIDAFIAPSPQIRGPHPTDQGDVLHEDPACWKEVPYLVLSYFDGIPLDESCQRKNSDIVKNPRGYGRFLGFYLSNILKEFHRTSSFNGQSLRFVYQDLKPSNILVSPVQKRCCLIDFGGMASCFGDNQVVNPGVATDGYAPPEYYDHEIPDAERIKPVWDVFSLGATLKECFSLAGVAGDIGEAWSRFLARCTEADPKRRYLDMQQVSTALASLN